MLETISQVWIFVFGSLAIWVLSWKRKENKWGYLIGLISQPAFLYSTIHYKQWGLVLLSLFYTYSWINGIYNHIIKD